MKNLIKKNQLMITALAIMIAIAGYLQFSGKELDDNSLFVEDTIEQEGEILASQLTDIDSMDSELEGAEVENYLDTSGALDENIEVPKKGEIPGEAVFTSTEAVAVLSEAKLLKEQTRAKNKEMLLEIINSENLGDDQKKQAVDSMVQMTTIAEKETAAQVLLEAKGFHDVVVSIHQDSADVVVNAVELDDAMRAQIEDIVTRKTDIAPENIIISTVAGE